MWKRLTVSMQNVGIVLRSGKPFLWFRIAVTVLAVRLFKMRRLRYVDFALGSKCNLKCAHCFSESTDRNAKTEDLLPVSVWRKTVQEAMSLGAVSFSFQGGEPLLYAELFEYIAASNPRKNLISVSTNGSLLNPTMARRLKTAGVDIVTISFDRYHNRQMAMRGICAAVDAGLSVTVAMTVTKQDLFTKEKLGLLQEAIDMTEQCGLRLLLILPVNMGRMPDDDLLTPKQCDLVRALAAKIPHVVTDFDCNWGGYGCGAGNEIMFVDQAGKIRPCPFLMSEFGDVVEGVRVARRRMLGFRAFREYGQRCIAAERGGCYA